MEFRKVELNNLGRLSEMFKLCLDRDVDESYFLWKYKNNPAGEVVAFEAVEGNTIAGFYGVIPEKYWVGEKEVTVYQSMDTMTHPDFQKRGLFTKLAKMTYDYLQGKYGSVYIVGIPGGNSFHGFVNKLGWKNIHNFSYIFLHRTAGGAASLLNANKNWSFEYAEKGDAEIDQFLGMKKIRGTKAIKPNIDAAVFNWKVWQHPFKNYKVIKIKHQSVLCGFCICSADEKNYLKIELLECATANKKQMIAGIAAFLFKNNRQSQFIYTWQPTDEELAKAYRGSFFIKNPFEKGPFSYRIPFITYSNQQQILDKDWFDVNEFDIQPFLQD